MFHEEADHGVALGFFGGLQTVEDEETGKDLINLKHAGVLPMVETVRLLALREGIAETSTASRIEALHAGGAIGGDDREFLLGGLRILTDVLLKAIHTQPRWNCLSGSFQSSPTRVLSSSQLACW